VKPTLDTTEDFAGAPSTFCGSAVQ
jgi:hypothetical protein